MKLKKLAILFLLAVSIFIIFFGKSTLQGKIPFPGDLLISEYAPWKTYSYLGYVPGSYPNKAQYFDVLRQLYPWKTLAVSQMKNWQAPLWNPYNFSGAPLLANFQSSALYPLGLLFFILPQVSSWSILVFFQPILAFLFTYLYARQIKISNRGAFLAGVSFGFSSFMTVWLEYNTVGHIILWLPLILFGFEKYLENHKPYFLLLLAFGILSALLAGHVQVFGYLFVFVNIYFLARCLNRGNKKLIPIFLLISIFSLGIGGIQLVPGIELILNSARSSHPYDSIIHKMLFQPWQLLMLFVPDFFGNPATRNYWLGDTYVGKVLSIGITPLAFAYLSIISKKDFFVKIFLWTGLAVLLLTTLNPLTLILYRFEIPIFSSGNPTLGIFIFCFSLSILAGKGLDIFLEKKLSFKKISIWLLPFIFLFASLFLGVLFLPKIVPSLKLLPVGFRPLTLEFAFFLCLAVSVVFLNYKRFKPLVVYFLLLLTLVEFFLAFNKFNPYVSPRTVFPSTAIFEFLQKKAGINRFWGYGGGFIEANFATQYGVYSPDGYDPLYPKKYGEFLHSSIDGKVLSGFRVETRSDANLAKGFGEEDLALNFNRLRVLDALGVKYVLDKEGNGSTEITFPKERFLPVIKEKDWTIYENLKSSPRAFLTSNYRVFKTNQEFEKIFFDKGFNPSRQVLVEKNLPFEPNSDFNQALTPTQYNPNKVVFEAESKSSSILFLSDTYYPGWNAYVDGKKVEIYKANYAFRGIFLPEGKHKAEFKYEPLSFKIGIALSILSLFGILLLITKPVFTKK